MFIQSAQSLSNCIFFALLSLLFFTGCAIVETNKTVDKHLFGPADYYYLTRAYPAQKFPEDIYKKTLKDLSAEVKKVSSDFRGGAAEWIMEGPLNISGRMNTIAVHPDSSNVMLVGLASGGIFKTTDNGLNWYPVFDEYAFLAIGHIVYDHVNPQTVYAGTGDPNISGYPFIGDGIYKSVNGGETWTYIGLSETAIISKLIVHPADNNIIYAGAMGLPFERNADRGLYKSNDAGASWTKVLYVDDDAGVIDIVSDPTNPDIIYAASWNRIRNNHESIVTGIDAKIWKSIDGGANWTVLSEGLPSGSQSRISIEMRADNPDVLYACYVGSSLSLQGIYKTTDGGDNWSEINTSAIDDIFSGFGWYFDGIALNTFNPDDLFVMGVGMVRTSDDGDDWDDIDDWNVHADKHAMDFISSNNYILATDGGLYRTTNNANTWSDIENIPSAQFYHVDINPHENLYWGGMQDNGTSKGNADGLDAWEDVYGGDGFHSEFRTDDADVFYVEYQNGGVVGYDGFDYFTATTGISGSDRRSWNMPYLISKHNPDVMYAGTYRMYKSSAGIYPFFNFISSDLTDGIIYATAFHTITTIAESNFEQGVLFAGTVDANVWRTLDDGGTWTNITSILPQHYVTDVVVSNQNAQRLFVSHSGYKENEFIPHIHRSDDFGDTWVDISGDLPQLAINAIAVHPETDNYIFVATDGGVYFTINGGAEWERLGNNMPVIPVYDLEFDSINNKLVAGTHARSVWSMEMSGILPPVLTVSNNVEICAGESVTLNASGAYSYAWSPSIDCDFPCNEITVTPLESTTYTVTGTDAFGLSNYDTINVIVNPIPLATISNDFGILVAPENETYSYQWYMNFILIPDAIENSLIVNPAISATYSVVITNSFGCADTAEFWVMGLSVNDLYAGISLSPNPAYENIALEFNSSVYPASCSLFDITGALIREIIIAESKVLISLTGLAEGTYLLQYELNGLTKVHKFQKL